jgi:GNAT superfamily N-acetyltransferase
VYILELAITRKYWGPAHRLFTRAINQGKWRWVDDMVVCITCSRSTIAYAVCDYINDELQPVGWIWLKRKRNWIAFEVQQLFIMREYRGNGYADLLYEAAINKDNLILMSGWSHTKHSTKMWARFVANDTFNIWAQDINNLNRVSPVYEQDGKVVAFDLDLYHAPFQSQDIRLIAKGK